MSQTEHRRPEAGIFASGKPFFVGCNYWASHAGTRMWRNWDAASVEADLAALSKAGVQVIRAFPLWPDFQPLTAHTTWAQTFIEMRFGEEPLPDTPAGRAGVDEVMIERFRCFAELAERYGISLIVGLVTGWMSGRMHVPPAFERVNVLTDAQAIRWQVRFVRYFVETLKDCCAIAAWDLGNECNCMGIVASSDEFWNWCNAISSAIRLADPVRPVVSGMHSLLCEDQPNRHILISDQAETTDILCTHPYPLFTPHCRIDPVNTMRNAFHAAAETRLYGDVGNVPAFVEEAGSLGPCLSSERVAADYLRNMLWNSYAHDCRGLLWWCGHDQTELPHTPYDWVGMERCLGLLRTDRSPKPVMEELGKFGRMVAELPLPAFRRDAVCILSQHQDQWGVGYLSFLLAKQAGFDIEFQYADQPLKPSKFYLLPSVTGTWVISRHRWLELLHAVAEGAVLYVSSDNGSLEPFTGPFGVDIEYVAKAAAPGRIVNPARGLDLSVPAEFLVRYRNRSGEVLAEDGEGNPALVCNRYGRGLLICCNVPLETALVEMPRVFADGKPEYYRVYQLLAELAGVKRNVTRQNPALTLTEHEVDADTLLVVAVNNTPEELADTLHAPGWKLVDAPIGPAPDAEGVLRLPRNTGAVLRYQRI